MVVRLRASFECTVIYQKRVMLPPPSSSLWLRQGVIVPDSIEVLVHLHAVFVLGCCEAEGVAGPFSEEERALRGCEEVGAHGVDVVGFGGGPDEDAVVCEGVG